MRNSECIYHSKNVLFWSLYFLSFSYFMCPCIRSCCLDLLPEASIIFIICSSFLPILCISLFNSRNVERKTLKHIYTDTRLFFNIWEFYITTMLSKENTNSLKKWQLFSSPGFLDFFKYFLLLNHLITICHDNICYAFVQIKKETIEMFMSYTTFFLVIFLNIASVRI